MGRILAIVNQKGGVGKSTSAVNLSACLAEAGKRVLLVDIDPQGNASSGVGLDKGEVESCMYDVLTGEKSLKEVTVSTKLDGLFVAPATIDLAGAEIELVSALSREVRLKRALDEVADEFDYVLIDSPPSLGLLTINGLTAADTVFVPIQCEYYALEGLSQLMNTLKMVKEHLNPALEVEGVVMTMFDARTNLSQQVVDDVRAYFRGNVRVFETIIPRNIRLTEAPSYGLPITLYDAQCKGAESYRSLAEEVMAG